MQAVPNDRKVQNVNHFEIFKELDQRTWRLSQLHAFLYIRQENKLFEILKVNTANTAVFAEAIPRYLKSAVFKQP